MDITQRKITKIAREAEKLVLLTVREEGVGTAEIDLIHALRHHPGCTQAQLNRWRPMLMLIWPSFRPTVSTTSGMPQRQGSKTAGTTGRTCPIVPIFLKRCIPRLT